MKRNIKVALGREGVSLGELRYDRQGRRENAAFAYTSDWLDYSERFAVDPTLPLVRGFQFHARRGEGSIFHGAIADTEPDGWGRRIILRAHARRRQATRPETAPANAGALGELDFLLAVDDESRVGALRFRDEEGRFQGGADDGDRRTPPLLELRHLLAASRAVELSAETARDLEYLRGRATSLGGLRPKCSVRDDDGRLAIAKFPSVADHLHNHGFLHVGHDQWRLAPAFDINPFPDRLRELKTWISHDTGPDTSLDALRSVAPYFRIKPARSEAIIGEVAAVVKGWRQVGARIGMTAGELDAFADAFAPF
jgi:hypothetical protein